MNSNQRSEGNNQSNNGGNELDMNIARAGTADRDNLEPATPRAGQPGSGQLGSEQSGNQQSGQFSNPGVQSGGPLTDDRQSGSQQSGGQQSGQPGTDRKNDRHSGTYQETGGQPSGAHQPGYQNADQGSRQSGSERYDDRGTANNINQQAGSLQSTDRSGSQTGSNAGSGTSEGGLMRQGGTDDRQSNDAAGSYPMSPGGSRQSADQKMDDDTGLSNTANRTPPDEGDRQELQSNVGRRSDGTDD